VRRKKRGMSAMTLVNHNIKRFANTRHMVNSKTYSSTHPTLSLIPHARRRPPRHPIHDRRPLLHLPPHRSLPPFLLHIRRGPRQRPPSGHPLPHSLPMPLPPFRSPIKFLLSFVGETGDTKHLLAPRCHVGGITELGLCEGGLEDGEAVGFFRGGEVGFAEIPERREGEGGKEEDEFTRVCALLLPRWRHYGVGLRERFRRWRSRGPLLEGRGRLCGNNF